MSLAKAIMHLYPGALESGQVTLIRDENGHRINYFDPALGTEPTQSELDAAEIAYVPPSALEGGSREPTSTELDAADIQISFVYWRKKLEQHIRTVSASLEFGQYETVDGQDIFVGNWNNALAYTEHTNFLQTRAIDFIAWRRSVWAQANTIFEQWQSGSIPAPTWEDLLSNLAPSPKLEDYQV